MFQFEPQKGYVRYAMLIEVMALNFKEAYVCSCIMMHRLCEKFNFNLTIYILY